VESAQTKGIPLNLWLVLNITEQAGSTAYDLHLIAGVVEAVRQTSQQMDLQSAEQWL